jgi:catechol 2,3-dioxygenase-like lactoylglutathione lyase family enzyme
VIAHIILNVKDFAESEPFYDLVLGQIGFVSDYKEEDEHGAVKSYRKNEHNLWIKYDKAADHHEFVRDVGLDHIALWAKSREQVDRIYEKVKTWNVKITRPPRAYPEYTEQYYAFYFRDPNGIPLEICVM